MTPPRCLTDVRQNSDANPTLENSPFDDHGEDRRPLRYEPQSLRPTRPQDRRCQGQKSKGALFESA